jgi:hypothetical protein
MVVLHHRGRPLRFPYPAWANLGGHKLVLGYQDRTSTVMVAIVPPDQGAVVPAEFGEAAKNPIFGAPFAYRDLSRGMGQRRVRGEPTGRYQYGLNVRTRSGRAIVGPELTSYTPATRDTTNGIDRFFEVDGKIFALNGRYALTGGAGGTGWTVSKDFGATAVAADVAVVQGNYSSSARYAWVGLGDADESYYFDGTTWTETTGPDAMFATAYAVDHDTFFRFDDANRMWTLDLGADPRTAANWVSATDRIGTKDHAVTRATIDGAGALIIAKADDCYSLNADGSVNRLFGALQFAPAATNGEVLARWGNDLYTTYGNATVRLDPTGGLTPVGPELMKENASAVKGYVTAAVGTDFYLLAAIKNPDTGDAYLLEHTGEVVPDEFGRGEPVWHGSIVPAQTGKTITALHTSVRGAPTGHKLLYAGFSDGTITTYVLACSADPADCSQERYSLAAGSLYYPRTYFGFSDARKALLRVTGEADNWSSAASGTFSYRTGPTDAYTAFASTFDSGERETLAFPNNTSCTMLDPLVTLATTVNTSSPQLSALSVFYQLRELPQEVLRIHVLAEDGLRLRDGTPLREGGIEIREGMQALAALSGGVAFTGPEEVPRTVAVVIEDRNVVAYDQTRKPHNAIRMLLIDQQAVDTRGTWARLEGYTWAELEAYTWDQLASL